MVARDPQIILATELYRPEVTSTGHYLTRLAEGLAADQRVTVVCAQPNYAVRGQRAPRREHLSGVRVFRSASTTLSRERLIGRALNIATFCASAAWRIVRECRNSDIVVAVTNPPFLPHFALMAAWLRRARFVLIVHDLYPDEAVAAGLIKSGSVLERGWRAATAALVRRADRVVAVGRDQAIRLAELRRSIDGIVTIPNWADPDEVWPDELERQRFRDELRLRPDDLLAVFAGNHGRLQDLDTLLATAQHCAHDERIHFAFVGDGTKRAHFEAEVQRRSLPRVHLVPARPRSLQRSFLCGGDVCLVSLLPGAAGAAVPSRIYNAFAAGTPILAVVEPHTEVDRIVSEHDVGWVARSGESDVVAAILAEIAADREGAKAKGRRARELACGPMSPEIAIAKYRLLLSELALARGEP